MLKNFWYAVEFAERLGAKPLKVTVLGQHLALYRTPEGKPVALSDLCVHRGAALSGGAVKGDRIVCPYHGWEYAPDGQCTRIPANPCARSIPLKARVEFLSCAGAVRLHLGLSRRFTRGGAAAHAVAAGTRTTHRTRRPVSRGSSGDFLWRANYERILENGCDISHGPFVHAGSFGDPERPEVPDYEIMQPDDGRPSRRSICIRPRRRDCGACYGGRGQA